MMQIHRREFLLGSIATLACGRSQARAFDAIVGRDGYGSIRDALERAPGNATQPHRILLRAGMWEEKLTIDKPFIHLIGEHRQRCVIAYGAWSGQMSPNGERWGTRRSATLTIAAPDCAVFNATIANSFDYDAAVANPPPSAAQGYQAVALAIVSGADRTSCERVTIDGAQDTLLTDAGRTSVRDCRIRGHVDFIFGAGTVWFDDCEIVARMRSSGGEGGKVGYLTAPSTLRGTPYGLVFNRCRLSKEDDVPAASYSLGRPWRPTTTFADGRYGNPDAVGQVVFLNCWMDAHIDAAGWSHMAYGTKEGGRAFLEPAEVRFREYRSRGPGAIRSPSRVELTRTEAREFTRERVLAGWHPASID